MLVTELFDQNEQISLDNYLTKCGVKDVEDFLNPSGKHLDNCHSYRNMIEGVQIYKYHLFQDDGAYILCDSGDTDGICSAVILYQYMKAQNPNWDIEILLHEGKQRGLQDVELFNKVMENPKGMLIIPDSGTNDKEQVNLVYEKTNMDVIVLDHHDLKPNETIEKGCLISNKLEDDISHSGSGALVTHKFLTALDIEFENDWAKWFIDMVALSLVSDSMDMSNEENRTYYHYGLETIDRIQNDFLRELFIKFIGDKPYTQRNISFSVVPKINSICRSKNQELKQRVILSFLGMDNIEEVLELCAESHKNQKNTVDSIIEDNIEYINELSNNNLIVFTDENMPQSYSGLISGKIMNICGNKPTIVGKIKDGLFLGSLRSPIPLREQLDNDELVNWASGHTDSCGVSINAENLQALVDKYNTLNLSYTPNTEVLKSYSLKSIPKRLYGLFDGKYNVIWGKGIAEPQFHITLTFNPTDVEIIGKNKRTLKLVVDDVSIMLFNSLKEDKTNFLLGYYEDDVFVNSPQNKKMSLELIGTLNINEFKGKKTNQIIIDKYEIKEYNKRSKENIW